MATQIKNGNCANVNNGKFASTRNNNNNNNNNNGSSDEEELCKVGAVQQLEAQDNTILNGSDLAPLATSNKSPSQTVTRSSTVDPRVLIPELCNHFYHLGWASGTGGGLSIRQDGFIYCAPSGVQKERIRPEEMFVLNEDGEIIERPQNDRLKCSECLSLFMVAFKLRNAGCCIHSHSINANLITALYDERNIEFQRKKLAAKGDTKCSSYLKSNKEFRITNQEMIKGIKLGSSNDNLRYNDTLVVPIIDNVLYERDLAGAMYEAVSKYPDSNAVLVRNHGVYVWGNNWMQAKSMAECYDYLFKLKLEAFRLGFDWMLDERDQKDLEAI